MNTERDILVVGDEPSVCERCDRILGLDGFHVDAVINPFEALRRAIGNDYLAILLDLKMDGLDGLEFLNRLRREKPDVPVIVITEHADDMNLVQLKHLGISSFLQKPLSPDEITGSVQKVVRLKTASGKLKTTFGSPSKSAESGEVIPSSSTEKPSNPASKDVVAEFTPGQFEFLREGWIEPCEDGTVRVGGFLPRPSSDKLMQVRLPALGDIQYSGLPLSALAMEGHPLKIIPSPVSGRVVDVNVKLLDKPESLWLSPCKDGWVARIEPSAITTDQTAWECRNVVLASNVMRNHLGIHKRLTDLGCKVVNAETSDQIRLALSRLENAVVIIDASSFGADGPERVARINEQFPYAKVVIFGDAHGQWEKAYRGHKIFYYTISPFFDMEIVDILASTFRQIKPHVPTSRESSQIPKAIREIRIINKNGQKVSLLTPEETLFRDRGIGERLLDKILHQGCPVETTRALVDEKLISAKLQAAFRECSKVLFFDVEDSGRIPGHLTIIPNWNLGRWFEPRGTETIHVVVQPNRTGQDPLEFDINIEGALAEHILRTMT